MKILTGEEARALDHQVMHEYGISEAALMESAGAACVRYAARRVEFSGARVAVVCGTGNNGGDGFVCARYAKNLGANVTILLFGDASHMGRAACSYRLAAERMGIAVLEIVKAEAAKEIVSDADIIFDALIGTGLTDAVKGEKAELIRLMNGSRAFRVAVDVPSGIDASSGVVRGACVKADLTVALGELKRAHVLSPAMEYCGEIVRDDIGFPKAAADVFPVTAVTKEEVVKLLPRRGRLSHKGENGHIGVVAGSSSMCGAALLSAQAALYAGGGKISLCTPEGALPHLAGRVPEIMVRGISCGDFFTEEAVEAVLSAARDFDAMVLGCGLGRKETTQQFAMRVLEKLAKPIVLDADALYAVAEQHISLADMPGTYILTPHVGEFARLSGMTAVETEANRIDGAQALAKETNAIVVLKGVPTVVAEPSGRVFVNPTGNPGMATGGMGDTLTGIIAALLGQGLSPSEAAYVGVYWHGAAGDFLAKETPIGYTAGDVARALPKVRGFLMNSKTGKE